MMTKIMVKMTMTQINKILDDDDRSHCRGTGERRTGGTLELDIIHLDAYSDQPTTHNT